MPRSRSLETSFSKLIIMTGLIVVGCVGKQDQTPTSDYNKLVNDYNDLAERRNREARRSLGGDADILRVSALLKDLDLAINDLDTSSRAADAEILARQCAEARNRITNEVSPSVTRVLTIANELAQGALPNALNRMAGDLSTYKSEDRDLMSLRIAVARTRMAPGLEGVKSLANSTNIGLRARFNATCAAAPPAEPRPPTPTLIPSPASPAVRPPEVVVPNGGIVSVAPDGRREILTPPEMRSRYGGSFNPRAFEQFSDLAEATGGFVGYSPTAASFTQTVDVVLERILARAGAETDVAIVLDTTSSMSDDIENVKRNMGRVLTSLRARAASIALRMGLVLYRDRGDQYVTKIESDFTANIDAINTAIQAVTVAGGGDEPEAVIDALDAALLQLSWRPNSVRSVVLIGDAPGHDVARTTARTMSDVTIAYRRAGLGVIIYPILVNK